MDDTHYSEVFIDHFGQNSNNMQGGSKILRKKNKNYTLSQGEFSKCIWRKIGGQPNFEVKN